MPAMSYIAERRQEEKERRRAEILDAAESVAASVGVAAMTMDEVARRARLSRALLYIYFQDKSDLMFGLCDRALGVLHQRFQEAATRHTRGLDQIEGMGRAYVAFSQEFPVYFEALALFEAHVPEAPAPPGNEGACIIGGDRVHVAMVESINAGIADGSIRRDVGPPAIVAVTLWGFMHGVIQLASTKANVLAHDGVTARQLIEHALVMAGRSLAAPD